MKELCDCLLAVARKIQIDEKTAKLPVILGLRVIEGPWENTKFLDVETKDNQYSAMLVKDEETKLLKMVAPFKVTKKDVKK